MRCRILIEYTSTFQSIEHFFVFLACFFSPKGIFDANAFLVSENRETSLCFTIFDFDADIETFNGQYPKLTVRYNESFHDRFTYQ